MFGIIAQSQCRSDLWNDDVTTAPPLSGKEYVGGVKGVGGNVPL